MRQLESLDVWRTAQELATSAYLMTMQAPLDRHFALVDQIRRASVSIPANIAEGYALGTTTQFVRFLRIALGSTAELRSHIEMVRRVGLGSEDTTAATITLCVRVISMLVGLLRKLACKSRSRIPFPVSRFPNPG